MGAIIRRLPEDYQSPEFLESVGRAQVQEPSTPVLLESLLVILVGAFEPAIAGAARFLFRRYPATLDTSERTFTWKELSNFTSLEDFRESLIDRAVDDLMRESADGWMKFFATKFKVKAPEMSSRIDFVEALQRRHVVVHNGGRVSRLYLSNLPDLSPSLTIDERLVVDAEYLGRAADALATVALGLLARMGRQVLKDESHESFEAYVTNLPYRLLQDGRFEVSRSLCLEFPPSTFQNEYRALVMRVNGWLALKRLKRFEECRAEVRAWQTASLHKIFQLARLALLDEMEAGYAMVQALRGTSDLSSSFWLTWPLLAELREYERQRLMEAETGETSVE